MAQSGADASAQLGAATALEQQGDWQGALNLYTTALRTMLASLKTEPDPARLVALREATKAYMGHAEDLKRRIAEQQAALNNLNSGANGPAPLASSHVPAQARSQAQAQAQPRRRVPKAEAPSWVGFHELHPNKEAKRSVPRKTAPVSASGPGPGSGSGSGSGPGAASLDPALRRQIEGDILSGDTKVSFDQVIGMESVKQALKEMVILPALRPDLFSGLRKPPRGLLMFGPPGNGKTFIAKAVASEARCTFFCMSASSLVSKNFGDSEKLVRALFTVARERAPSIIFIDELDSLLSKRSADEHEASRRIKTEFLIQLDGVSAAGNTDDQHVVVIGATNLPDQLDDAVLRRLTRRIYVPHPDGPARAALISSLLAGQRHTLSGADLDQVVALTDGYSASDLKALCQDAAMGPLRGLSVAQLADTRASALEPIGLRHFRASLESIPPSVPRARLAEYEAYAKKQQAGS